MKRFLMMLATMAATLVIVPVAGAVTINVNTTADAYGGSAANCSLREAITAAQTNAAFDGCAAGAGSDEIVLPAGEYKITRAGAEENNNVTGDFDVLGTGALNIRPADGAKVVINANGLDRAYDQRGNSSFSVTGQQVIGGALTAVGDDGAGISNTVGQLTVSGSTINDNSTKFQGGAVAVYSNATIVNSTLSGNAADGNGGALWVTGGASLVVKSSTIANNTADAEGNNNGHGGGFADGGATNITFYNTINASNKTIGTGGGPDCYSGPFFFPRFVLTTQALSAGVCLTGFNPPTNKVVVDPKFGPLKVNGDKPPTHPLLAGSPAIGAGATGDVPADACPEFDQIGNPRPAGACDIGAVQYVAPIPPPPATLGLKFGRTTPKLTRVKRGKRARVVTLRVVSTGSAALVNTRVCLKPTRSVRKALKIRGKFCRKLGTVVGTKPVKIRISARKKAKKKLYRIKAVASANGVAKKSTLIKVRVK